jgi:hypothetical protein
LPRALLSALILAVVSSRAKMTPTTEHKHTRGSRVVDTFPTRNGMAWCVVQGEEGKKG